MAEIDEIQNKLKEFNKERDWDKFHNLKDLAIAISLESSELLELFLWKESENVDENKIKEELADILNYCFIIAYKLNIDIKKIMLDKIHINGLKYPVAKSKGRSNKYNEL